MLLLHRLLLMLLGPDPGHTQPLEVVRSSAQGQERRHRRPGSQGNLEWVMQTLQLVMPLLRRWVTLLHHLGVIHAILIILSEDHIIVRVYCIVTSVQLHIVHLSTVSRW